MTFLFLSFPPVPVVPAAAISLPCDIVDRLVVSFSMTNGLISQDDIGRFIYFGMAFRCKW